MSDWQTTQNSGETGRCGLSHLEFALFAKALIAFGSERLKSHVMQSRQIARTKNRNTHLNKKINRR